MPSRVVRGEINASASLSRVSRDADLTFRCMITAADDWGRLDGRLPMLKALLFPMRDSVTLDELGRWIDELVAEGCVARYEHEGRPYVCLTGWETHRGKQRRAERGSRFPDPPRASAASADIRGSGVCRLASDESRESGEGEGRADGAPPSRRGTAKSPETDPPERLGRDELARLRTWCAEDRPDLMPRLDELVAACLDWSRGKGKRSADWEAECRFWLRRERRSEAASTPPHAPIERTATRARVLAELEAELGPGPSAERERWLDAKARRVAGAERQVIEELYREEGRKVCESERREATS